ncbi:hypothetical protein K503DRAFT_330086 [Rhizopogon vinicolor AM-OR11-026]|uniref:Heterokaryon incompatibility domain-containing protein n=1 Tax=Rhizopogon vinicolor AM-OR11-026 TaxID=1314800 RepID=A0A1B7MTX0_9AGAM|nr:hypothetical protein K503DRAFT_330086 [Rhizopogon vinicolor AM-OR11-026]
MGQEWRNRLEFFDQYVMNEIPIRLIRLSDMKLVGRNEVRTHFRPSVPQRAYGNIPYHPTHTVRYAILSHRWQQGEPSYTEMRSGSARGPGYEKLKKFCENARTRAFEFAWSDTCCIDERSSAELDESIRSMFRWYRNSDLCIIHLAQSETIADIMNDEWMERGWTLQELLAPRKIKLFNKHWAPMTGHINDKSEFTKETGVMKTLGRVTGIPLSDVWNFEPGPVRVDERMTWAARRKTTRVEDVAYSLMGIFNVSIQVAYGEGGDRAFGRLIEAIMQTGDPSVFNWTGEAADYHPTSVIPRSPQNFADRTLRLPSGWSTAQGRGLLAMTMTSLGLRVPLVLFPLNVNSFTPSTNGDHLMTVECPLCPSIRMTFVGQLNHNETYQFALGIVNYTLGSCDVPRIRGKSVAFILQRPREDTSLPNKVYLPKAKDFVELKAISPPQHEYYPWRKASRTGLVEITFPNMPSDSIFYVSPEYLEVVYL